MSEHLSPFVKGMKPFPPREDIDNEVLRHLYVDNKFGLKKMQTLTGWPINTMKYRLKKMGVYVDHPEAGKPKNGTMYYTL